jgi:hypothetical protein
LINWVLTEPNIGNQLRVKVGNFFHHGIYIGNNEVIQFGSTKFLVTDPKTIRVEKVTLEQFLDGGFLEVRVFTKKELKEKNDDLKIVAKALSKIGDAGYDILKNNCEHFCNECIFNVKSSEQINDIYTNVNTLLNK